MSDDKRSGNKREREDNQKIITRNIHFGGMETMEIVEHPYNCNIISMEIKGGRT